MLAITLQQQYLQYATSILISVNIKTNSTAVVELQNQQFIRQRITAMNQRSMQEFSYNAIYDTAVNELGMVYPGEAE